MGLTTARIVSSLSTGSPGEGRTLWDGTGLGGGGRRSRGRRSVILVGGGGCRRRRRWLRCGRPSGGVGCRIYFASPDGGETLGERTY